MLEQEPQPDLLARAHARDAFDHLHGAVDPEEPTECTRQVQHPREGAKILREDSIG